MTTNWQVNNEKNFKWWDDKNTKLMMIKKKYKIDMMMSDND